MPDEQNLEKLLALLKTLPENTQVLFDDDLEDDCEWVLMPVTESCDDDTVLGYVVTNKTITH